jgi:transcriptional regulator with XRE-family HTH domain
LTRFGDELRHERIASGLSQAATGHSAGISGSKVSRIEAAKLPRLSLVDAFGVAAVVGLDVSLRTYPGGNAIRDTAQARRLQKLLAVVAAPLQSRAEAPLPATTDVPEQRAWDATVEGAGAVTAIELEMRLYDLQAQQRRLALKVRDGAPGRIVLVVADTHANRRILREHPEAFGWLPRLPARVVLDELRAGRHPPSALILL